ncbi:MAG: hypothetical protein R3C02_00610 [Planctomycetaceae bacterium]
MVFSTAESQQWLLSVSPLTKFFVVDTDVEQQFEYAADGTLVDNYSLSSINKGALGTATTSDGSAVHHQR